MNVININFLLSSIFCYYCITTLLLVNGNVLLFKNKNNTEIILGTNYLIRTVYGKQNCYITVHDDGTVDSQYLIQENNAVSNKQLWSIAQHPYVPNSFQLKQDIVPFNMLSGYQNTDDGYDPPLFPKQLTFNQVPWGNGKYQIEIRVRWCLRFLGFGYQLDIDDCEWEYEPEKLWDFIEVSSQTVNSI